MKMGMKATVIASMFVVGLIAGTAVAQAGSVAATQQQQQMQGNMMGSGMMGGGMMGGHMMNGGMMGKNMMGGHDKWSMGCNGMMGGAMMNQMSPGQQQEFMNQTVDLRKQMMEKRFSYMEAMRNPDTTLQDLANMEKSMLELRTQMMDNMNTMQGK